MSLSFNGHCLMSMRRFACGAFVCMFISGTLRAQEPTQRKIVFDFEGNKIFSKQELAEAANKCLAQYSIVKGADDSPKIEYCLFKVKEFLLSKGYLTAKLGQPRRTQTEDDSRIIATVDEGAQYRLREIKVEGLRLFTPAQILELVDLKAGEIADGDRIAAAFYERVHKTYAKFGYIQYTAEITPHFHLNPGAREGIVDLSVTIDEGQAFTIRSIKFEGNGNVSEDDLRREMLVGTGEIFNKELFDESLKRISQSGQFETIDVDKDVNYEWKDPKPRLDLTIRLKRKRSGS